MEFVYRMSQNSNIRDFFNKSGVDWAECSRRVAGAIRSLVNGRDFHVECAMSCMKHCCTCSYVWQSDNVMEGE